MPSLTAAPARHTRAFTRALALSIALGAAALLSACAEDTIPTSPGVDHAKGATLAADARTSDWSAPQPLSEAVRSPFADAHPTVPANQLSLYFTAGQGLGGEGRRDLWVTRRTGPAEPWGAPVNLGPLVNSPDQDDNPTLSADGHWLYFSSDRPGSQRFDLWVAHRADATDDFGWGPPVNLGPAVNSAADERDAEPANLPGGPAVYFTSNRAGSMDIWIARGQLEDGFGEPVAVAELNGAAEDENPTISPDGREIYFASDRGHITGRRDLWVATRRSPVDRWSEPVRLGGAVNGPISNDVGPDLSTDGRALYFSSAFRDGNVNDSYDLWVSYRQN